MGRIAFVDLSSSEIVYESIDEKMAREYIGGYGIGARVLYERMKPKADPLGPDSIIGFTTGPLVGTKAPTGGRWTLVFKSPVTGGWGDANCGGYWGSELKAAGLDALFIKGIAASPVYLWVGEEKVEIRDASKLWSKDTYETEEAIRDEHGDKKIRVASIGPASEKLSLITGVATDGRFAARSGGGAVMGSKNLKAIAVRGSKKVPMAHEAVLKELAKGFARNLRETSGAHSVLMKAGTCAFAIPLLQGGATPVKNWSQSGAEAYPNFETALNPENILKYQTKKGGCANCPILCGGKLEIPEGPYQVAGKHKKPEYETLAAFGPMCMLDDTLAIIKLNDMCNRSGLDTISAGAVLAFAIECFENGIITKDDTSGIELNWGNAQAMIDMLQKIIDREGLGDVLADGVKKASEKIGKGSDQFAVHVQGVEPGYHSPLMLPLRSVGYAADPTPGRHTTGLGLASRVEAAGAASYGPYKELLFEGFDRYEYESKGPLSATVDSYWQTMACAGLCYMGVGLNDFTPFVEILNAVTGWDTDLSELLETGRRIQTMRQQFNIREGCDPTAVQLPGRMTGRPAHTEGPNAGVTLDEKRLVAEYWKAMGFDPESGIPLQTTLEKLGIKQLVADYS
jgi:aldehyde:ferredoxin oxidoreductase